MKSVFLIAFVLAALACSPIAVAENTNETTFVVRNGYIIAPIFVYDHWRWFVVDTGQNVTAFHTTFTNHLVPVSSSVAKKAGIAAKAPVYSGPQFFLAGHHSHPKHVSVSDIRPLEELAGTMIDGILGLNVLTNYTITFDFAKENVGFATNVPAPAGGVPLRVKRNNFLAFPATIENQTNLSLAIDTADRGEISLNTEDWAKVFPNGPARTNTVMIANLAGKFHSTIQARLPSLKIGDQVYTNLLCCRAPDAILSTVGSRFLQRHRVVIDYPNRKILLERVDDGKPAEENVAGIHLKWIRRSVVVAAIDPASPADQSGLAEGDLLLRLGDKRVSRMDLSEIEEQFRRSDNEILEIVALHGPEEVTRKIVLKRRL